MTRSLTKHRKMRRKPSLNDTDVIGDLNNPMLETAWEYSVLSKEPNCQSSSQEDTTGSVYDKARKFAEDSLLDIAAAASREETLSCKGVRQNASALIILVSSLIRMLSVLKM